MNSTSRSFFLGLLTVFIVTVLAGGNASADGLAALERGDYATAREQLEPALESDPDNIELRIALGRTLMAQGNARAAATEFEQATKTAPDSADAHYWYGAAHGTLAGNASLFKAGPLAKKARRGFETALHLDPKHTEAMKGMITYYLNAPKLFGGDKDKAMELVERLTEIDPLEGRLTLIDYYAGIDEDDRAMALAEQAAKEHPNDPRPHLQLGFMAQGDEDFENAMIHFKHGAAAAAVDNDTRVARQGALYQVGRTAVFGEFEIDDGIDALSEYVELEIMAGLPSKAWAMYRLGLLYQLKDEADRAESLFRQALAATGDNDLKRQIRQRL